MKKWLAVAAVVGLVGYGWNVMNDGKYDPNAKYIGNTKSYKFHRVTCRYAKKMAESNKFYAVKREKLVNKSMKPCGFCKP